MMFGAFGSAAFGLPSSLVALLAVLPTSSLAWSIRATAPAKNLGTVLAENTNLTTYLSLVKAYPDILLQLPSDDGVTLVAPNNAAFSKYQNWDPNNKELVTSLLQYHILQGVVLTASVPKGASNFATTLLKDPKWTNVTTGQQIVFDKQPDDLVVFTSGLGTRSTVVESDIPFTGGLVQVVETIMVPPARLEPTARDAYKDLQSFLGALYLTGLVREFAESPNVTIFAPRDIAFQRVAGALTALSKEELTTIMRYHIVSGQVLPSKSFSNTSSLATSSGKLKITRSGNNLYFDRAQLLQPDILLANGALHIIDGVLNPNNTAAAPDPALGTQTPAYPQTGATATGTAVAHPFTSALPCTVDCPVPTATDGSGGGGGGSGAAATSGTGAGSKASKGGAAAGPRCTGMAAAVMVGVAGMGLVGGIV
ncbi:fasciclin domain-containing protein [Podospora didyma]|uniref:Fasciclin domain-containing protein n=1 Tax=Podospora didyma TaxID=330526 RepID=A0AAE0N6S1_9PEZI|nr:fasciclin domain-containing protein [Podospora didyma]